MPEVIHIFIDVYKFQNRLSIHRMVTEDCFPMDNTATNLFIDVFYDTLRSSPAYMRFNMSGLKSWP